MTTYSLSYRGHRFPAEIISHAVWLYFRFGLSFRDTEDLLAQRGISVTYESIAAWGGLAQSSCHAGLLTAAATPKTRVKPAAHPQSAMGSSYTAFTAGSNMSRVMSVDGARGFRACFDRRSAA